MIYCIKIVHSTIYLSECIKKIWEPLKIHLCFWIYWRILQCGNIAWWEKSENFHQFYIQQFNRHQFAQTNSEYLLELFCLFSQFRIWPAAHPEYKKIREKSSKAFTYSANVQYLSCIIEPLNKYQILINPFRVIASKEFQQIRMHLHRYKSLKSQSE